MKLYGKSLEAEIAKRKEAKVIRGKKHQTLRQRADELDVKLLDYVDWENGRDICPHEKYRKSIGGVHPPFLLMNICTVCGSPEIIAAIKTEEDLDKHEAEIEEALKSNSERNK